MNQQTIQNSRISWIDTGKALAIAIVFFSHMIENISYQGFKYGMLEARFVGCFCIQFFFFISGFVSKDSLPDFRKFALKQFNTLLIPLFFFNIIALLLLVIVHIFYQGPLVTEYPGSTIFKLVILFGAGLPSYNGPTWFLTCLFTAQMLNYFTISLTISQKGLFIVMIIFSLVGYLPAPILEQNVPIMKFIRYFWFIPTAFTAVVFFQLGRLIRRSSILNYFDNRKTLVLLGFLISAIIMAFTFNLNHSAYTGFWKSQHMNNLNFGNYFIYYAVSFVGIACTIFLCMLIKPYNIIIKYGQNTLSLLGLSGIIHYFVNPSIFKYIFKYGGDINYISFLVLMICITIIQLAICYPFFNIIKKCLSSLVNLSLSIFSKYQGSLPDSVATRY